MSIQFQAIMAALPGLAALFGVVALAYAQANDHRDQRNSINDAINRIDDALFRIGQTETEQTSICNSVLFQFLIITSSLCFIKNGTQLDFIFYTSGKSTGEDKFSSNSGWRCACKCDLDSRCCISQIQSHRDGYQPY